MVNISVFILYWQQFSFCSHYILLNLDNMEITNFVVFSQYLTKETIMVWTVSSGSCLWPHFQDSDDICWWTSTAGGQYIIVGYILFPVLIISCTTLVIWNNNLIVFSQYLTHITLVVWTYTECYTSFISVHIGNYMKLKHQQGNNTSNYIKYIILQ